MIKKLLLPFAFILFGAHAMGQRFDAGLLAGFNASQVEGDNLKGYHKPGILAGIFVQTDIMPTIFTGMEIKYSQKGSRRRIRANDPAPSVYIMRLGYVDIPLFVGFRTNERTTVVGGVTAGYLVHSGEYNEYGLFPPPDRHEFNRFDLQPFAGFQFALLDEVKLDLRLALSILPIRGHPGEDATTSYWLNNQFNNVISLAFYYNLGMNR